MSDQLSNGRRFRILNIVDDYSREMVGQLVSVSISSQQASRFLSQHIEQSLRRLFVTMVQNLPVKRCFSGVRKKSVKLGFIQPSKPTQNAVVECLNGKFRNECLNQHWFRTMEVASYEIDKWREHYNFVRPHSSLNYLPPVEYAKRAA